MSMVVATRHRSVAVNYVYSDIRISNSMDSRSMVRVRITNVNSVSAYISGHRSMSSTSSDYCSSKRCGSVRIVEVRSIG